MKRRSLVITIGCVLLAGCGQLEQAQTPPAPTTPTRPTSPPRSVSTAVMQATAVQPKETAVPQPPKQQPTPEPPSSSPQPTRPSFAATPLAPLPPAAPAPGEQAPAIDPALAALIASARADLARRQSVAPDAIEVVEARAVTWPDPGLGCPQPGMIYKQVPVDGALIRLRANGAVFSYHSGNGKPPFLCDQKGAQPAKPPID